MISFAVKHIAKNIFGMMTGTPIPIRHGALENSPSLRAHAHTLAV